MHFFKGEEWASLFQVKFLSLGRVHNETDREGGRKGRVSPKWLAATVGVKGIGGCKRGCRAAAAAGRHCEMVIQRTLGPAANTARSHPRALWRGRESGPYQGVAGERESLAGGRAPKLCELRKVKGKERKPNSL